MPAKRTVVLVCLGCHNKMPYTGGLNNRSLFFTVLGASEVQIKVPTQLGYW